MLNVCTVRHRTEEFVDPLQVHSCSFIHYIRKYILYCTLTHFHSFLLPLTVRPALLSQALFPHLVAPANPWPALVLQPFSPLESQQAPHVVLLLALRGSLWRRLHCLCSCGSSECRKLGPSTSASLFLSHCHVWENRYLVLDWVTILYVHEIWLLLRVGFLVSNANRQKTERRKELRAWTTTNPGHVRCILVRVCVCVHYVSMCQRAAAAGFISHLSYF